VVDCDPIFVKDGPIWTAAGVPAGMDRVLFPRRPGSQSQFSVPLRSPVVTAIIG
jgi:hypothetical protein